MTGASKLHVSPAPRFVALACVCPAALPSALRRSMSSRTCAYVRSVLFRKVPVTDRAPVRLVRRAVSTSVTLSWESEATCMATATVAQRATTAASDFQTAMPRPDIVDDSALIRDPLFVIDPPIQDRGICRWTRQAHTV